MSKADSLLYNKCCQKFGIIIYEIFIVVYTVTF